MARSIAELQDCYLREGKQGLVEIKQAFEDLIEATVRESYLAIHPIP